MEHGSDSIWKGRVAERKIIQEEKERAMVRALRARGRGRGGGRCRGRRGGGTAEPTEDGPVEPPVAAEGLACPVYVADLDLVSNPDASGSEDDPGMEIVHEHGHEDEADAVDVDLDPFPAGFGDEVDELAVELEAIMDDVGVDGTLDDPGYDEWGALDGIDLEALAALEDMPLAVIGEEPEETIHHAAMPPLPPAPPIPAVPDVSYDAQKMIEVSTKWGKIKWYRASCNLVAEKAARVMRLTRTTKDTPHAIANGWGRPVGLLVAWLKMVATRSADEKEFCIEILPGLITKNERLDARRYFSTLGPAAAYIMARERPAILAGDLEDDECS